MHFVESDALSKQRFVLSSISNQAHGMLIGRSARSDTVDCNKEPPPNSHRLRLAKIASTKKQNRLETVISLPGPKASYYSVPFNVVLIILITSIIIFLGGTVVFC